MSVPTELREFFKKHPRVALGFSGGVDSSYLLYAAKESGAEVKPYFIKSQFQPEFELVDAKRLAGELGIELTVIPLDVTTQPEILKNPADRCYACKRVVFSEIIKLAKRDGYTTLIDGNNASDDATDRPGMRAVEELQVLSPLRILGLTKTDVRALSKEAGLFTWDKPSYACLATRIPTNTLIDPAVLKRVELSESVLAELGFRNYRVRVMGETAKLQLREEDLASALASRVKLLERMSEHFSDIVLDLKVRQDD